MKFTGGNRSTRRETCLSATLVTTNLTWTDPGSNPGLRGERPATNRLSHGTSLWYLNNRFNRIHLAQQIINFFKHTQIKVAALVTAT
jgi:hypothetical protein